MSNSNLERSKIEKGGKRLCIFTKKKREREKDCVYLPNQGIKWYNKSNIRDYAIHKTNLYASHSYCLKIFKASLDQY